MPHQLSELSVSTRTKPTSVASHDVSADVCIVGSGIAGMSAAIESARLGRDVVLVDALPVLGGQMVNSLIGVFCGVFGNAPRYEQLTHSVFDQLFEDLSATGDIHFNRAHTTTVYYDEVAVGRWFENTVHELGIRVITGAVINAVDFADGWVRSVTFESRYGSVTVRAAGFIDASGDAALAWEAGLPCRIPDREIYGSQQLVVEHLNEDYKPDAPQLAAEIHAKAEDYGLVRRDGLAFFFPGRSTAVLNMTHIEAPLDPVQASVVQLDGKEQADRVVEFLRSEFPKAFGSARVRAYGFPGRRQTRWIQARHQLTLQEVREGTRFDDAIGRTAWPIELHDRIEGYVWEPFDSDHVHYVPLGSLTPPDAHNLLAAGRCLDGEPAALSSVRVMGPCAAMGAGAAHALDLSGTNSVHDVDLDALSDRVGANLGSF
jgi:2-polyprenyl-6-methoxyphenol hydroxylase-like FAD-dependent oxidoreductase